MRSVVGEMHASFFLLKMTHAHCQVIYGGIPSQTIALLCRQPCVWRATRWPRGDLNGKHRPNLLRWTHSQDWSLLDLGPSLAKPRLSKDECGELDQAVRS